MKREEIVEPQESIVVATLSQLPRWIFILNSNKKLDIATWTEHIQPRQREYNLLYNPTIQHNNFYERVAYRYMVVAVLTSPTHVNGTVSQSQLEGLEFDKLQLPNVTVYTKEIPQK
ncbi:unnamed protein product [Colias eurytheme]|nr:unnamed protein product [Colias eurytheme]